MKSQHFVLLAGSLALVALLLLVAVRPAKPAEQVLFLPAQSLTVVGEGSASARSDQAELHFGIWNRGASAVEAEALNAASIERVMAALKAAGVDEDGISHSGTAVTPELSQVPDGTTQLTGFHAESEVQAIVRNLNRVGEAVEAALGAGATSRAAPVYSLQNPETARQAALNAALADARSRAEALARAGGRSMGELLSIEVLSEDYVGSSAPETLTLQVKVKVTFSY